MVLQREMLDCSATPEEQRQWEQTGQATRAGDSVWALRQHQRRVDANRREFPRLHQAKPVAPEEVRDLHQVEWTVDGVRLRLTPDAVISGNRSIPLRDVLAVDYINPSVRAMTARLRWMACAWSSAAASPRARAFRAPASTDAQLAARACLNVP